MTEPDEVKKADSKSLREIGWFRVFVAILALGPVLLFFATQLGRYSFLCELLSNFQVFVFFLLLPFPVLLYCFRWKRLTLAVSAITLCSFVLIAWVYVPIGRPPAGSNKIKVMSYNVLASNPNHAQVLDVIRQEDPDLLMVVEYSRQWISAMKLLDDKYSYRYDAPRWHGYGIAFFSKLPITQSEVISLGADNADYPAIVAHVQVGNQQLRVAGVHLVSPVNQERLKVRNTQLKDIGQFLGRVDEPTILVGDFNSTVWSPHMKQLQRTAKLSDSRQGFGYMASWNANDWPFQIPIDHAFVSRHLHVHDRGVGSESGGSDHFPITCEISLTPEK